MLVPKVSICIPAYNNVNEVKRLLESIFLQRFKNYEIILTDDSTNNEISELIEQMGRQKIRYIHNPKPLVYIHENSYLFLFGIYYILFRIAWQSVFLL